MDFATQLGVVHLPVLRAQLQISHYKILVYNTAHYNILKMWFRGSDKSK